MFLGGQFSTEYLVSFKLEKTTISYNDNYTIDMYIDSLVN